jgi:hypothetical protein
VSKITVTVETVGKPDSFTFGWEGNTSMMRGVIEETKNLAHRNGCNAGQFVREVLTQVPSAGPLPGPEGVPQLMVIMCAVILYFANKHPEETLDGLAKYDAVAAVTIRGEDFSI